MNTALDHAKAVMRGEICLSNIEGAILAYTDELRGRNDELQQRLQKANERIVYLQQESFWNRPMKLDHPPVTQPQPCRRAWTPRSIPWPFIAGFVGMCILIGLIWTLNHFFA